MGGFGFLSLASLAFSALAIPIFLLYMLRLRRTDMPISSTFLWQQLVRDREANAPWQRLRLNWLLFLQLLILAVLVLALARPYQEVETITRGRIVLLLDASASMNATDLNGQTRFAEAQKIALDTINTLGEDDTMTVIRVGEVPEVLAAATRDRTVLRRAIREATPSVGKADWPAALTLAASGSLGVDELQVVVLSDGGLPDDLPVVPGEVLFVKVGESDSNVGITVLSVRQLPDQPPQMFAQLENFSTQGSRVILELRLDGEFYNSQFYTIPAGDVLNIVEADLPENFTKLEARLSPPSNASTPDYLRIDDVAYAVHAEAATGNVLLITEGNIFLEELFENLTGINLTVSTPEQGILRGDYDLIVFDSWLPNELPTKEDIFIINPTTSTNLFAVSGESTDTAIDPITGGVSIEDERTRFLDFSSVAIRNFQVLEDVSWADFLVETENGDPLVLAGEFEGQQVAILTFALSNSNLPLQIQWPILVANLMDWYRPQRAINVISLAPAEPIAIRPTVPADTVVIRKPNGERIRFTLDESPEVFFADTAALGFYDIEILLDGDIVQTDSFAVNLFDRAESNIRPIDTLTLQGSGGETVIRSTTGEETGRRELWRYFVYIGLIILGIEWWYYHRSRNRKIKPKAPFLQGTESEKARRWWAIRPSRR
ncbi:MAG: hypothetical protein CUN55_01845 [Phototrophicales bacterium]|nr:MAG: hypothetical protein CUN55_01845 [Phototrophicales bacterium]